MCRISDRHFRFVNLAYKINFKILDKVIQMQVGAKVIKISPVILLLCCKRLRDPYWEPSIVVQTPPPRNEKKENCEEKWSVIQQPAQEQHHQSEA